MKTFKSTRFHSTLIKPGSSKTVICSSPKTLGGLSPARSRLYGVPLLQTTTLYKRYLSQISLDDKDKEKDLQHYGKKKQTGVSLKALMETGRGDRLMEFDKLVDTSRTQAGASERVQIQVACFLHRELPVRLAHRALELEASSLFSQSPSIRNVASWYKTSFAQLRECQAPTDIEKEAKFAKVIESIYERLADSS